MIPKIRKFLDEARTELRHINWPTREEAIRLTGIVIILSLALAVFLGAADYLFSYLLRVFVVEV